MFFVQRPFFDEYSADFLNFCIRVGTGIAYLDGKGPKYPDKTIFELNSEGFTQEEINQAFAKALQELKNLRKLIVICEVG